MLPVAERPTPKQESVSLETTRKIVPQLTRELALVLEGTVMTPTRVETKVIRRVRIMETKISRRWDTSWFSKVFTVHQDSLIKFKRPQLFVIH